MFSKTTASRIAVGLFAAAIALGEGVARAQSVPPPIYLWSGTYLGLNLGIAQGADAISEGGLGFGISTSGGGTMSAIGFTGGVAAGYNWQSGGYLLGIETDVSYIGLNGTQDMAAANFTRSRSTIVSKPAGCPRCGGASATRRAAGCFT